MYFILIGIALLTILNYVLKGLYFIQRNILREICQSKTRIFNLYGKPGTYAVITGGSDGIGLSMCKILANQGFNICIIARNEQKMKDKLIEIKESITDEKLKQSHVGTYVVCDFAKFTSYSQYKEQILPQL